MNLLHRPSHKPTRRLTAGLRWLSVICCVCFLGAGCDNLFFDVEDVRLQPVSQQDVGDVGDVGDAQLPDAVGDADADDVDARDVSDDVRDTGDAADAADAQDAPDVPDSGEDVGYPFGDCNPITGSCPTDEYCKLRFEPGNPPRLFTVCDDAANAGSTAEDEPCSSANDCTPHTYCVNWSNPDPRGEQCTRYCEVATGDGCEDDEFCTNPFDILDGLGFCTKSCDPLAAGCPSDTQCHPHPGYTSGQALEPHFQCLAVDGDFSTKDEGSGCDVQNVNLDGCATGLVCYPTNGQDRCVKPCSGDNDCTSPATCEAPAGAWSLRFCSF